MEVHQSLDHLPEFRNPVLTIGTFDGVHHGHQQIIRHINEVAQRVHGESVLLTFHPHPRLVINPDDDSLRLITTMDEKIALLDRYGIDHLVIATFSLAFSRTEPKDYIKNVLVDSIHPRYLIIGYDHHFGRNRQGNIQTLKQYADEFGYEVEEIPKQIIEDISVSSTKIRKAVTNGDIEKANLLLDHPFLLTGTVIKGQQIGKSLGFPTANLFISDKHKLIPPSGVFAVRVVLGSETFDGMLYIGNRPTFSGTEQSIEVNIFDFNKDIYGNQISLELMATIRGDMKFDSEEALKQQMAADKEQTLEILDSKY